MESAAPIKQPRWAKHGAAVAVAAAASLAAGIAVVAATLTPAPNVSINSTSQNAADVSAKPLELGPVPQQPGSDNSSYQIVSVNDLGMHCGDLDTRIASILPPFQVKLAQVIRKGSLPLLMGPADVDLFYSAAANPVDPILSQTNPDPFTGLLPNGDVYKTNFWSVVQSYDPFYPPEILCTANPTSPADCVVPPDQSLVVPNTEHLYIGPDDEVNSGDEFLSAVQHPMPGISHPYHDNTPQPVLEHYGSKPFFVNFPFGYVADNVNWFEAAGIPLAAFDDFGRENPYPMTRVQAKAKNGTLLASLDTVLPISGEASCRNCHASTQDVPVSPDAPRAGIATKRLQQAKLPVANAFGDDPEYGGLPANVSIEYATDINVLRLHDLKHGSKYVNTSGAAAGCSINQANPNGDANCLTNKALLQHKSVVCQLCHYTPALDLAQFGPLGGDPSIVDGLANGRVQRAHASNSAVMHYHHGTLKVGGKKLFPDMPAPVQNANGVITNQAARTKVQDQTCYQCHPGKTTRCLRGAMFQGGMLCNDCHGNMDQVGNDFSIGVSPSNPSAFKLGLGNFYDPSSAQPRVPWANEPGCGSCHTGDALSNLAGSANTITRVKDIHGNVDGIRLMRAYRSGDAKATPIVPSNKRFAEPAIPATFNSFANPGAGNPKLYRVSTGHGGVMCEGCHGATHSEWPNAVDNANDNVMAKMIQGHTGPITECTACHGANFNPSNPLGGPHGMHVVGNTRFSDGGHHDYAARHLQECAACHGARGQGSVLSRAAVARTLDGKEDGQVIQVAKGQPISCSLCHENPYPEGGASRANLADGEQATERKKRNKHTRHEQPRLSRADD